MVSDAAVGRNLHKLGLSASTCNNPGFVEPVNLVELLITRLNSPFCGEPLPAFTILFLND